MSTLRIEKHPDRGYRLSAECIVPRPLDEVFAFFANAENLDCLTPPWLRFRILTPTPLAMGQGQLIDYRLRVHGAPIRWRSEITAWDPPHRFIDELRRGPYRYWRHEHRFEPCPDGTRVIDEIHYGVPGGALVHRLFVRRDLLAIFAYRHAHLEQLFPRREPNQRPAASAASV
jgi:ligand-binding SRPBCC domain-containing protein